VERRELGRGGPPLRGGDAQALARRFAPPLTAFAAVAGLAAADGGYFPTAWGWAALGFLLLGGSAFLISDRPALGRLDVALVAALTGYAAWVGLSTLWSPSAAQPLLELERSLVYAMAALALLLVTTREEAGGLLIGTWAAIVAVALYGLATRLVPDRLGEYPPPDGYQLAEPLGYWNALGALVGIGAVLAFGLAALAADDRLRIAAAASLPVLAAALYFTFSRGSWLAVALAFGVLVVIAPARLRLLALGTALAVAPAAAVLACSRSTALTLEGATLGDAAHDGHRISLLLAFLVLLEAGVLVAWLRAERSVIVGRRGRLAFAAALLVAGVFVLSTVFARTGSPVRLAERASDAFTSPLPATGGDLNRRLLSFSGNGRSDYWRVAWKEVESDPLLGTGAGGYERVWLRERPTAFYARDAHNLYLEALAELGPLGLALLLGAVAIPFVALLQVRREPLAPVAGAAFAAFLVHAAVDWDWEMPAVTIAALCCGLALVAWARPEAAGRRLVPAARLAAVAPLAAVTVFVFVMHAGNTALARSETSLEHGELDRAADEARTARRWLPWSFEPWHRLAEAQLAAGDAPAARASLREAIDRDSRNWSLWYALAVASNGAERAEALGRAAALNPRSPEVAELRGSS
jgi:O-antigen ligase